MTAKVDAQNNGKTTTKGGGVTGKGFAPGQSGNPGGRPKKKPLTELYERILADPGTIAALEKAVIQTLRKGNMAMVLLLREMTERIEGKMTQTFDADVTVNLADVIAAARKRVAAR